MTTTFLRTQWRSDLCEEGSFYPTIPSVQQVGDVTRVVPPVGIEGEQAAVHAADVAGEALQLPSVVIPDGAVRRMKVWMAGTRLRGMPYESK